MSHENSLNGWLFFGLTGLGVYTLEAWAGLDTILMSEQVLKVWYMPTAPSYSGTKTSSESPKVFPFESTLFIYFLKEIIYIFKNENLKN